MPQTIKKLVVISCILLSACQSNLLTTGSEKAAPEQLPLIGQPWQLITLTGKSVSLGESDKPLSIEFLTKNSVFRGFAGCNNYSGSFSYSNNTIEFGPAMATRKYCANFSAQESHYFTAISNAKYFIIKNQQLIITDKIDQVIAVYEPLKGLQYSQ